MRQGPRERARSDIISLVHRGLSERDFALAATRALRPAVPFDGVCVVTLDLATGLPTGEVVENGLPDAALPRLTEIEIGVGTRGELVARLLSSTQARS